MPPLTDWIAPGVVLGILGLALGIWRWVVAELRQIKSDLVEMDSALRGYKGQGGALAEIEHLKHETATVDARITASRHDLRGELQKDVDKIELGVFDLVRTLEQRVYQRIFDLGVGRPKSGE